MEKIVYWCLSWTCNGRKHTRQYDSDHIAQICYDECIQIKANTDVKLTKVTSEVVTSTVKPRKRLRNFASITFQKDSGLEYKNYELTDPAQITRFAQCLTDRDVFSVSFYVCDDIPNFILRRGYIKMR